MNPITQPGTHPDVESLNAFVEQALSESEREQILAHMVDCGRCRQVVYLAQEAAEVEKSAQGKVPSTQPGKPHRPWFGGWRWAWIPATAIAGLVGLAVVRHQQQEQAVFQVARNTQHEQATRNEAIAPQAATGLPSTKTSESSVADEAGARLKSPPVDGRRHTRPSDAPAAVAGMAEPSRQMKPEAESSSDAEEVKQLRDQVNPAQKPSSTGGPYVANNATQQQSYREQQTPAKDQLHSARYAADALDKADTAAARADGNSASVLALSPPPASAAQPVAKAKGGNSVAFEDADAGKKEKGVVLPTGMSALSAASARGRTVAVDASGSLFLTETPGGQWMPITKQWTGRAILVRARQASQEVQSSPEAAVFELVNDEIQTWVSSDGKIWHIQPPASQP